ncbi:MAG: HrpE/YscL family type III secretion apparatus protein [Pseudomonadota bacterium]
MGPFFYLNIDRLRFFPDNKVIKGKDYLSYVEADNILQKAQQEAENVIAAARETYEEEKKRGYQEGFSEGKMSVSEQMMNTVTQSVDYVGSIEEKVAEIVIMALKKIIGQEINDPAFILKIVRNALNMVKNQQQVTIRVSPLQVERVKEKLHEIMSDLPEIRFIDVVPDQRLNDDDCILETEIGVVDARIDVQIEAIRKALLKSFTGK